MHNQYLFPILVIVTTSSQASIFGYHLQSRIPIAGLQNHLPSPLVGVNAIIEVSSLHRIRYDFLVDYQWIFYEIAKILRGN